jgi:hypothetical protein
MDKNKLSAKINLFVVIFQYALRFPAAKKNIQAEEDPQTGKADIIHLFPFRNNSQSRSRNKIYLFILVECVILKTGNRRGGTIMVIEQANLTTAANAGKPEQDTRVDIVKEPNLSDRGISEAGETSEIGPAVVNNISAATLETSRAVNAPEQSAAQSRLNDTVEAEKKGQNNKTNEELVVTGNQALQKSKLDATA